MCSLSISLSVIIFLLRSADKSVHMFDRRNLTSGGLGAPVHKFAGHKAAVLCVQACYITNYF